MDNYIVESLGKSITNGQQYASLGVNQTYSFIDNTSFFSFVNDSLRDYYYRSVRINLQWYDGWVVGWHNVQNGIFSTRIANALVNGVANQVFGKKLSYKKGANVKYNTALDFIRNEWSREANASEVFRQCMKYTYATGTSLLKLNLDNEFKLWIEAVRNDYFYYETDFRNKLVSATCFIKSYMNTNKKRVGSKEAVNYFVVEHRSYKDMPKGTCITYLNPITKQEETKVFECLEHDVPVVEYQVHRYTGNSLNNQNFGAMQLEKGLKWEDIPLGVRKMIKDNFSAIRFNEPMRLPFKDLGCELVLRGRDTTLPNLYIGESILSNIRADLEQFELNFAFRTRDMWNGQGQVGIPKNLTMNDVNGGSVYSDSKMNYQLYEGDPDKQKPVITQFELRVAEWVANKDDILKSIATKIGMSPKIIASYLADATIQKTATQIDSDDDSVIAFVETERAYFEFAFNNILNRVLKYYGYSDIIEVKFGIPCLMNQELAIKNANDLYQNGYIDLREALSRIFPDADEGQLDQYEEKAKARQEEIKMSQPSEIDDFGKFLDEAGQ